MKKLLFIILTLLFTNELFAGCWLGSRTVYVNFTCGKQPYQFTEVKRIGTVGGLQNQCLYKAKEGPSYGEYAFCGNSTLPFNLVNGEPHYILNPQDGSQTRCDDIYEKNGVFYSCNPNTNEPRAEPDMELLQDPESGELTLGCKNDKFYSSQSIIGSNADGSEFIPYTERTCTTENSGGTGTGDGGGDTGTGGGSTGGGDTGTGGGSTGGGDTGTGGGDTGTGGGSTGGGDTGTGGGSTGGGSTGGGSTGGGDTGTGGGSTGGGDTGTGGGSTGGGDTGTGGGDTGTGGGDTGTGGGETPPIDETPATCDDSGLNLQEKMLCEMNKGIKKLNSEATPSNSLNQLMKDLNNKSTEQNETLDGIRKSNSSLNEKISQTNTKLDNLNTSTNSTNTKLDNLNTSTNTTNTKLDNLNTSINSTNSKLDSLNTSTNSTNSKLNEINSSLKNIENGLNGNGEDIDLDSINNKGDSISNGIDALFDIYSTFSTNIQNQFSNIKTQIQDTQNLIIEPSNIFNKTEIVSCPTSYIIDFSSFGISNKTINIDFCEYTSTLKPLIYLFVYVVLMLGLISLAIRFIGVII